MSDIIKTTKVVESLPEDAVLERNVSKTINEKEREMTNMFDEIDKELDRLVEIHLYNKFEPTVFDF